MKSRDPDSKTWEEKDIAYLLEMQKKKEVASKKKNRFFDSVDQKKLQILTEVKTHGRNRSAKALHFTKDKNTLEAAEAWITEHAEDADIDQLSDEFLAAEFDVEMTDANGDVIMEEPDTRKVGDPNPEEVKVAVNQEILKQMMEMGFSEFRCEKALYLRDNNLEHAIAWLGDHGEDADIDLPIKPKPKVVEKPKMSPEEAAAKAAEIQKRIRDKKKADEELAAKEKEAERVINCRKMAETAEKMKEEERKRAFEQLRIEKEASERDRIKLKEQLRLDYIDRFGKEPPAEDEGKEKEIKTKPNREQMLYWLGQLKKNHKDTNKDGLKTCLNTLKIYGTNLKENPNEPKFKSLKMDNKAFQGRIVPFPEALEILLTIGFENKDGVLTQKNNVPDGFLIGELLKFSDIMLGQI